MGLDATVYCDCLEHGKLRSTPLSVWQVHTDEYGGRSARTGSVAADLAFDDWNASACEHANGVLLHHRLGSIGGVAALRAALAGHPDRFPLLLSKVVYSGTHCGDLLPVLDLPHVAAELEALHAVHMADVDDEACVRQFERQFGDLVQAALSVGKPIAF